MDQNSNYFFNSAQKEQTEFWNRNFHILLNNNENFEIQNDNCTSFYKRSKILKKCIPRLYSVQCNYLVYGDRNLKGFRKLDCVYLISGLVEGPYKYQLQLIYCGFILELYTDQKKDYDSFKEILQSHCILTDFHTQYTLLRQIGFGSSAQVYIARSTAKIILKIFNNHQFRILLEYQLQLQSIVLCYQKSIKKLQQIFKLIYNYKFYKTISKLQSKYTIFQFYQSIYLQKSQLILLYSVKQKKFEQEQALHNEIQIMKELNHPNIISFYSVFETNRHINIVLELIQGGELLKQGQYKSIRDARIVAKQLALCLDYMHQKGIMHRDLKPQNILCKSNSLDVLIADFGLAAYIKAQKQQYYRCGTTGYVAPEILMYKEGSKMYNEKCDIFSLGVIYYQLIFNTHPFKDSTKAGMLKRNLVADYKLDDQVKVPQSCKDLIASMLRLNPKQRPSASQILRHDFFNEALNELSYPSLIGSIQDISDHKKSGQSFNSQVGELKLSTFQKNGQMSIFEKMPLNIKSANQSMEFKELSPLWNKKIILQQPITQPRSKAQSMYSNKNLDNRGQKVSIFRQQSKNSENDIDYHQFPYQTIINRCTIKNK